jgi:glutaredoxin 3
VNVNPQAREEFSKLGTGGVPTFVIGGQVVTGFDKSRIEQLADHRVIPCPECGSRMRVPKGKGRIRITCSNCRRKFETTT